MHSTTTAHARAEHIIGCQIIKVIDLWYSTDTTTCTTMASNSCSAHRACALDTCSFCTDNAIVLKVLVGTI